MLDPLRNLFLRLMHVPPQPHPPDGSPESILTFRAGRNLYRLKLIEWALIHVVVFVAIAFPYLLLGITLARKGNTLGQTIHAFIGVGLLAIFLPLALLTFLAVKWQYELRWYIVTDRSLRVRSGIWTVNELTMTFANIQEIRVRSGPLQNFLGLADVEVTAAGGGVAGPHGITGGHAALFEGVANANEVRDILVERLREYRELGLGGADNQLAHHPQPAPTLPLDGLQLVLQEARALRTSLEQRT